MVETADVAWYRPVKAGRFVATCPSLAELWRSDVRGERKGKEGNQASYATPTMIILSENSQNTPSGSDKGLICPTKTKIPLKLRNFSIS